MRPLELHIRDFRSFAGEATFDFRDRTLVGIVGPIGAGKSSILDAIAYALYARTPRVAGAVRDLINQRKDTAIVRLMFDVDGELWQVTRSIRKSQSNHTLQQLDEEGGAVETVTQKAEVNQRVEELIGLDFDGFSRSVLLAQGRFAEFLNAQPAQRDRVLKGVFGHERIDQMRQVARDRSGTLSLEIEKLTGRLETLAVAEQRLVEQRAEMKMLSERLETLEKIQPRVSEVDDRLLAVTTRAGEIDERTKALAVRVADLPEGDAVDRGVLESERAKTRRAELASALDVEQANVTASEAALASLAETSGTLDEAAEMIAAHGALASKVEERSTRVEAAKKTREGLVADRAAADDSLVGVRTAAANAEERLVAVATAETAARASLDRARHDNMAHTLRGQLADGDVCPVCTQTVADVPAAEVATDVAAAEAALEVAAKDVADAQQSSQKAAADVAAAETRLATLDAQITRSVEERATLLAELEATRAELADITQRIAELIGEGDPADIVRTRRGALDAAREAADTARKEVERVRAKHDQAIRDEQTADKQLAEVRLAATRVASALGVDFESDTDDSTRLSEAIAELRRSLEKESAGLATERSQLSKELTDLTAVRTELLESAAVTGDLGTEITSVGAKVETLGVQIDRVEKDLAAQEGDRAELASLERRRADFDRIVSDLTDAKFVRYLLDDERVRLAALASEHFERLSSGRYRFSVDGKFDIIDMATADVVRKADSLSGGETFLASLGLALGLAEMVARSGGRLEAFFLDEGFGTLDPEHLHLAMEGIERLVTESASRLVVVVSHVPELRQRIEDLIELEKNPLTGDTVVLRA
jgi:exonuclease SbcC